MSGPSHKEIAPYFALGLLLGIQIGIFYALYFYLPSTAPEPRPENFVVDNLENLVVSP